MNSDVDCSDAEDFCEETDLNLNQTEEISYQPILNGELDGLDIQPENEVYEALPDSEEDILHDALVEKWKVAASIFSYLETWKEHPEPTHPAMQTYEKIVKEALDVSANILLSGANAHDITDEHIDVMICLYCLGQKFLHFVYERPDAITIYRGLGYNLPFVAKQILETSDTDYSFKSTVVTNFTGSEARSLAHSRVQIRFDIEIEGIVFPLDQLLKHREGGIITERDGELQVCGDLIPELSSQDVYVVLEEDRRSLQNLFHAIPDLNPREHFAVRDIIIDMAYRELQFDVEEDGSGEDDLSEGDAVETLNDWFSRFTTEYPAEAVVLQDLYEYVIGEHLSRPDTHSLFHE